MRPMPSDLPKAFSLEGLKWLLDCSSEHIEQLECDGLIERSAPGQYTATSVQAVVRALRRRCQRPAAPNAVGFLRDLLCGGPIPATTVIERGAARGFSYDQLRHAKQKLEAATFKEKKLGGRWLWALPPHEEGAL